MDKSELRAGDVLTRDDIDGFYILMDVEHDYCKGVNLKPFRIKELDEGVILRDDYNFFLLPSSLDDFISFGVKVVCNLEFLGDILKKVCDDEQV